MRRPLLLGLVLAVAIGVTPSGARAQQSALTAEAITAMLQGVEDTPSVAQWQAIGPSAVPVLAQLVRDAQQPGFVRLRAIQALSAFSTPAAHTALRRIVRDRTLQAHEPLMVREAALALARAFGERAVGDIAPLLAHHDTAVREGAIRALGGIQVNGVPSEAARARLRARLPRESDGALREQIQRALGVSIGGSGSTAG